MPRKKKPSKRTINLEKTFHVPEKVMKFLSDFFSKVFNSTLHSSKELVKYLIENFKFFTDKKNWNFKVVAERAAKIFKDFANLVKAAISKARTGFNKMPSLVRVLVAAVVGTFLLIVSYRIINNSYLSLRDELKPDILTASIHEGEINIMPDHVIYFNFQRRLNPNRAEQILSHSIFEENLTVVETDSPKRYGIIAVGGWRPDSKYKINLGEHFLKNSFTLSFTTIESPKISVTNLQPKIASNHEFLFAYNQDIFTDEYNLNQELPENYQNLVRFEPAVEGSTEILSPSLLRFIPDAPLKKGKYNLNAGLSTVVNQEGIPQNEEYAAEFEVVEDSEAESANTVLGFSPIHYSSEEVRADTRDSVYLLVNDYIDKNSIIDNIEFQYEYENTEVKTASPGIEKVMFSYTTKEKATRQFGVPYYPYDWSEDRYMVVEIVPDGEWSENNVSDMSVVLKPPIKSINGSQLTDSKYEEDIKIVPEFGYLGHNLSNVDEYEDWYRSMWFDFNNEILQSSEEIADLVNIYDQSGARVDLQSVGVYWESISIKDVLEPGEKYTVVFDGRIADIYGSRLGENLSIEFTYPTILKPERRGFVSIFGTVFAMVDNTPEAGINRIYMRSQGYENLKVEFARISPAEAIEVLEMYSSEEQTERAFEIGKVIKKDDKSFSDVEFNEGDNISNTPLEFQYELKDIPDGLYIARLMSSDGEHRDFKIMSFTSVSGVIKVSEPKDEVFVWLANLASGQAVKDVKLILKTADEGEFDTETSVTNESGVAYFRDVQFSSRCNYEYVYTPDGSIFISSDFNRDLYAHSVLDPNSVRYYKSSSEGMSEFIYLDKPIYRIGDTVNVKAFLREHKNDEIKPYLGEIEIALKKEYSGDDDNLALHKLNTTEFGTVSTEFKLSEEIAPGNYHICILEGSCRDLVVLEYQPLRYSFTVTKDNKEFYRNRDSVNLNIDVNYYFGEPVANAEVDINLYIRRSTLYSHDILDKVDTEDLSVDNLDYFKINTLERHDDEYVNYDSLKVGSFSGRADKNGKLNINVPFNIPEPYSLINPKHLAIEVATTDDLGETQYQTIYGNVLPKGGVLATSSIEEFIDPDNENLMRYRFSAILLNEELKPRVNSKLKVELLRDESYEVRSQKINRFYYWEEVRNFVLEEEQVITTDEDGFVTVELSVPIKDQGSDYDLKITSIDYPNLFSEKYMYNYGYWHDYYDTNNAEHQLEIKTDKEIYEIGDVATLVPTVKANRYVGLLTYERRGVMKYKIVDFRDDDSARNLKINIDQSIAPNAFVSLYAFSPHNYDNKFIDYRYGVKEIKVTEEVTEGSIEISTDKQKYFPDETVKLDIKNLKEDERTEYLVAAVDKAVLDLAIEPHYPDLFESLRSELWNKWELGSFNAANLTEYENQLVSETRWGNKGGGAGGGGYGPFNLEQEDIRNKFEDVAVWLPHVVSKTGTETVEFQVPDNLTTWQLVVVGLSEDGKVSVDKTELMVSQDVNILSQIPNKMYLGDQLELNISAIVGENFASENSTSDLKVELVVDNGRIDCGKGFAVESTQEIREQDPAERVAKEKSELTGSCVVTRKLTEFPMPALYYPDTAGEATLKIIVGDDEVAYDALERKIEVLPNTISDDVLIFGDSVNEKSFKYDFPDGSFDRKIELTVSDDIVADLRYVEDYFYNYSNMCSEQTSSSILALLPGSEANKKYADKVQELVDYLAKIQNSDGGWGYWAGRDSYDYNTAYVIFALIEAREAGFEVSESAIDQGVKYLDDELRSDDSFRKSAFGIYVLSENGIYKTSHASNLYDRIPSHPEEFQNIAYLLKFYKNYLEGDEIGLSERPLVKERISDISTIFMDNLYESEHTAKWSEASTISSFWRFYQSDQRVTAIVLESMLQDSNKEELLPVVNYLKSELETKNLGTLNKYHILRALTKAKEVYSFSANAIDGVEVNGIEYKEFVVNEEENSKTLQIPLNNDLSVLEGSVLVPDDGLAYYDVKVSYSIDAENEWAQDDGMTIYTEIFAMDGTPLENTLKWGEQYKVRAYVGFPNQTEDYMPTEIRVPVPAGLLPLNTGLATKTSESMQDNLAPIVNSFGKVDFFENEVVFFVGESDDYEWTNSIEYYEFYVMAANRGEFMSPGANGQEMYLPGRFTKQKFDTVVIE